MIRLTLMKEWFDPRARAGGDVRAMAYMYS